MNRRELLQTAAVAAYGSVGFMNDSAVQVIDSDAILLVVQASGRLSDEGRSCINREMTRIQKEVKLSSGVRIPFIILDEGIKIEAIRKGDVQCES